MRIRYIIIIVVTSLQASFSQQGVNVVLKSIEQNNKAIKTNSQYLEAEKQGYKIGIFPSDPKVEYGYYPGSIDGIGVKEMYSITQEFDFPTVYLNRKKVLNNRRSKIDFESASFRQEILLKSKLTYYELVYLTKKNQLLQNKFTGDSILRQSYERRFQEGHVNALESNKIRLQYSSTKNKLRLNVAEIESCKERLIMLNGGVELSFKDISYLEELLLPLDLIIEQKMTLTPDLESLRTDIQIARNEMKLNKSLWFPALALGYESESVLGETFKGMRIGISIPLWQNTATVKRSKAEILTAEYRVDEFQLKTVSETERLVNKAVTLKRSIDEYQSVLDNFHIGELLDKALDLGQISIIEYFVEMAYYFSMTEEFLGMEKEYYQLVARIYNYSL